MTINTTQFSSLVLRASMTAAFGMLLAVGALVALPHGVQASYDDGWGDCSGCDGGWTDEYANDYSSFYPDYSDYGWQDEYANDYASFYPDYSGYGDSYPEDYGGYYGGGYSYDYCDIYYCGNSYDSGYSSNNYYSYDSYDYSHDTYTYTYSCPSGYTGTYPNCHAPHTPTCADQGLEGTYPNCHSHTTHHNDTISCDLTASDRSIEEGDDTKLRWTIDGDANYASINHGVGHVDEEGGSETVSPDSDTTYTLTVRNSDGDEDTCSVDINVDQNNNFSSVTFTGEPTNNPPVVYLSSIPYTGLEDIDPTLLTYYALLIAAAGIAVWFAYQKGLIPQFAFSTAEPIEEGHVEGEDMTDTGHVEENSAVASFLASMTAGDTDAALEEVRVAAANGTGVEEFLADAAAAAPEALQSRIQAAYDASKLTGIRGAKEALA